MDLKTSARERTKATCIREIVKNCDERHNFFSNRVVNAWNDLPPSVTNIKRVSNMHLQTKQINAKMVNDFKKELDNHKKMAAS